ncbi:Acyl-CoA dehydrogenase apdG [Golovinomyces cichoracearum]|uniref:Acyl-CoA dehydrogenase apdG n=1 Tax=Golovinomyces cichoracearum TaxID=62708 RepID=A0A420IAF2_9PEZI|nr:Acyl-CoA dehydrogenase apdG [Golovinomyces cichoracearum]
MDMQRLSPADVATHNKPDDIYVIVDENVYDLTEFQDDHPGGKKILSRVAGKDASSQFWKYHNEGVLKKYKNKLLVGVLDTKDDGNNEAFKEIPEPDSESNAAALIQSKAETETTETDEMLEPFGDMIPFADPSWYQGFYSPYYNVTHVALRREVREWITEKVEPFVSEWEEDQKVPEEIYKEMGTRGYLAGLMGSPYCSEYTNNRVASVSSNWDVFHELILTDEISRAGSGGFVWNVIGGFGIGAPPVMRSGSEKLKKRILPEILNGNKRICLAVTEPDAGSDVSNIRCEAVLSEDGKYYVVNGEKKWITNGIWCDYFTTAVRTGTIESGMSGISTLLIERSFGGVNTRKMDCQGVFSSGTTYVTFEDVKVPVENLIGKENQGFKVLMANFNHERIGIIVQCLRFSRVCYEESVKYAHKRRTFGKPLIKHPVIRLKLAHMVRQIEASYSWLESIVAQAGNLPEEVAILRLGGPIASLKAQSTVTFEFCAREASQIFGGLSYSRGGQGGKVERLYRDVRAYAIPGGSEEIMLDLSIRQSLKVSEFTGMKL